MKQVFLILFICVAIVFSSFAVNPPGTQKVKVGNETWYFDKNELKVIDYQEYIYYKTKIDSISIEELQTILPDSNILKNKYPKYYEKYNPDYQNGKFAHFSAEDLPLVGLTREQVEGYCAWRSERVCQNPKFTDKGKFNIVYSLPSEEQIDRLNERKAFKEPIQKPDFPQSGFRCIATIEVKK